MANARYQSTYAPQAIPKSLEGTAFANPLQETLDTISNFAKSSAVSNAQDSAQNAVFSGENPGAALGITPAGQAYNQAAEHAYAVRSEGLLRDKANELATQYDGRNPTDPQAFSKVYGEVVNETVNAVPERFRPRIAFEAKLRHDEAVTAITGRAQQIAFQQDTQASQLGAKDDFAEAVGKTQIGRHDLADLAIASARDKYQHLVQVGAMNQAEADLHIKSGLEDVAAEGLYKGFLDGHVSLEAVQSGKVGDGLSAPARDHLISKIEAEMGHRRSEQNHAMAVQDHVVAANGRTVDYWAPTLEAGGTPNDATRKVLVGLAQPGALVSPVASDRIRAALAAEPISKQVATATPADYGKIKAELATFRPSTPEELARVKIFSDRVKLRDEATGPNGDTAAYATAVMPDKFPPIALPDIVGHPETVATPEFEQGMQALAQRASLLKAQLGGDPNPLTKSQQYELKTAMTSPNVGYGTRAAIMASLDRNFAELKYPIIDGLGKEGATVSAHVGWLQPLDPAAALSAMRGEDLLKDPTIAKPIKEALNLDSNYADGIVKLHQALDPLSAQIVSDAVTASYADAFNSGSGSVDFKTVAARQGAMTTNYNGREILLPHGVTDKSTFDDRVRSIRGDGPDPDPAARDATPEILTGLQSGDAILTSLGGGHYKVQVGVSAPGFVLDYNGIKPKPSPGAAINLGVTSIPVGPLVAGVGAAVEGASSTARAVVRNTTEPLADAAKRYLPPVGQ